MLIMKTYKVKIERTAEADLHNLFRFLVSLMSREGANRYIDTLINEVQSLSILADLYRSSRHVNIRKFHPKARRMVLHNKKWVYIFHVEEDVVVVDRIYPAKMIAK